MTAGLKQPRILTQPQKEQSVEIAELMGGKNVTQFQKLWKHSIKLALEKAKNIRARFNFEMLGIDPGQVLEFKKDPSHKCVVVNETQVKFRDEIVSLSKCADILLREMGYDWVSVQGPRWWCIDGKTLSELRNEFD